MAKTLQSYGFRSLGSNPKYGLHDEDTRTSSYPLVNDLFIKDGPAVPLRPGT